MTPRARANLFSILHNGLMLETPENAPEPVDSATRPEPLRRRFAVLPHTHNHAMGAHTRRTMRLGLAAVLALLVASASGLPDGFHEDVMLADPSLGLLMGLTHLPDGTTHARASGLHARAVTCC